MRTQTGFRMVPQGFAVLVLSGVLCKSNMQAVASVHALPTPCNAEQRLVAGVADLIRVGKSMGCLVTSLLKVPCLVPCTPCFLTKT